MKTFEFGLISVVVVLTIFLIATNFAESNELICLRLYQDINEISRTPEMQLAEQEAIQKHRNWIFEYVEKDCPDFFDLEFIYNHYKQNLQEVEPTE